MDDVFLYEEYRLIERNENEISGAWKGAHLLLFFLIFISGLFCTFCFNMVMYMFDENCVLFPKLLLLSAQRHNVIYEFIPENTDDEKIDNVLPVDFVHTQWADKHSCYLPTYVPLVSGIFGLIWTALFFMCSTGSRTLTGMQRPWRALLPVFLFSLAMGGLCVYTSIVTYSGLQDLCIKLGQFTGSSTCTYTINVATLSYERRIRGVYQATRLTILSAWLHTLCWLTSALLVVIRVILAVDFQLVRVKAELNGNVEKMLERQERQIRTVSPEPFGKRVYSDMSLTVLEENISKRTDSDTIYISTRSPHKSEMSLVSGEKARLARIDAYRTVPRDKQFIVKDLYDLIDSIDLSNVSPAGPSLSSTEETPSSLLTIVRQFGHENISLQSFDHKLESQDIIDEQRAEELASDLKHALQNRLNMQQEEQEEEESPSTSKAATSTPKKSQHIEFFVPKNFESELNITLDMRKALEEKLRARLHEAEKIKPKKSNLKNTAAQTGTTGSTKAKDQPQKVEISESKTSLATITRTSESEQSIDKNKIDNKDKQLDKETQTRKKDKQD